MKASDPIEAACDAYYAAHSALGGAKAKHGRRKDIERRAMQAAIRAYQEALKIPPVG